MVPGFGEAADFTNAVISFGRRDYTGVVLSLAAMIPVVGILATYAKFGMKALPAARKIQAAWGASVYRHGGLMNGIEHIMYRHGANSGFKNVSRFAKGTTARDIKQYVDQALRNGNVTQTSATEFTVEYNIGRVIGTNIPGNPAKWIRVHVRDGIIQTAFPF
jgi:filamentous hemagglutinin